MAKTILLTGAGFTHNFGGPLADGMWAIVFNHPKIQKQEYVKKMMLKNFDYESIYHKILKATRIDVLFNDSYTPADDAADKDAIKTATFEAYEYLDKKILSIPSSCPNINKVNELIERFASNRDEKSFFFTLNQDLFIERHFSPSANCKLFSYPGIKMIPDRASSLKRKSPLELNDFICLPDEAAIETAKSVLASSKDFHYVKLHGSYGWNSSDGSNTLVIGRDKESQINNEPLLSWYLEIFRDSLKQDEVKLLTIGYSFNDEHINKIIADSIKSNRLKLYILSPEKPKKFIDGMSRSALNWLIVSNLSGYFQYNLQQIFPEDQTETEDYKKIADILFG